MKNIEKNWIVVASDMDGLTGYQVVHRLDERDLRNGSYWGGIVKGLSLSKKEMEILAEQLNAANEPAPENPFRGVFR
jgi:hypothetical protein